MDLTTDNFKTSCRTVLKALVARQRAGIKRYGVAFLYVAYLIVSLLAFTSLISAYSFGFGLQTWLFYDAPFGYLKPDLHIYYMFNGLFLPSVLATVTYGTFRVLFLRINVRKWVTSLSVTRFKRRFLGPGRPRYVAIGLLWLLWYCILIQPPLLSIAMFCFFCSLSIFLVYLSIYSMQFRLPVAFWRSPLFWSFFMIKGVDVTRVIRAASLFIYTSLLMLALWWGNMNFDILKAQCLSLELMTGEKLSVFKAKDADRNDVFISCSKGSYGDIFQIPISAISKIKVSL